MADLLELGNGTLKEGIHGVKCLNENESCKVTLPPQLHGIVNMEDHTNRNMHENDCVRAPYSAPNSEIGLLVKEDFYTNKSISKVELPEMITCTNDGSCHRVENLLAAEEGYSFQNNLAKKEEVGQKVPLCSNNSLKNENNDVAEEMEGTTSSLDFEYELIERHSYTIIDRNPADPTSSLSSIEDEDKLDTAEQVASNGSCNRLENSSIAEEVHYFKNSLPEEDEVGQKALFCSNNSLNNDNSHVANEMKGIASSHGFEHEVIDTAEQVASNGSCHRLENSSIAEEVHYFKNSLPEEDEMGQKALVFSNNSSNNDKSDVANEMKGFVSSHGFEHEAIDTAEQVASNGSCHRLENSSIAEEVHYLKNSLPEEDEVGQKALFCSNNSLNNDNSDVANEMKGIASSHGFVHEVIDKDSSTTIDRNPADPTYIDKSVENFSCVSSSESGDKLDAAEQVAINVSEDGDLLCRNGSTTCNILDEVAGKQLPPSDDLNKESLQEDLSVKSCSDDQKHSIDRMKIDQAMLEGNKSTSTIVLSAAEDPDGDKEIISTCKVPSGVIAFTFDAKEASMRRREVKRDVKDIQQAKQAHSGPRTEGATSDGATTATPSSFLHLMQGESNFHGPSFLSGPIANSGHIPYSGSISIRSDSSTTSARSFAFPILQSEWNSSPVKMAKARRQGRKLFCCRF